MASRKSIKRILQNFVILFGLFYSTIIISYFKWGTEIEEPTIRESVTYFVFIMYALFGYLLWYFISQSGGNSIAKSGGLYILKLIILVLIICVFLYLGGLLCYIDSKLYTTPSDTPWIYASISLWSIFLLYILYELYHLIRKFV